MNPQHTLTADAKQAVKQRDPKFKEADIACTKAIAQAAVNLELFTIPLYMTSMYSITGTHQIQGSNDFYTGRWWPGIGFLLANSQANPPEDTLNKKLNREVFGKIYKVFMEEMLHLQLASNMSTMLGVKPSFTSDALQDNNYGWHCYGKEGGTTIIPHILDLQDCKNEEIELCNDNDGGHICTKINPGNTRVKLGAMNIEQAELFITIESTEDNVQKLLKLKAVKKYFPTAPFDNWTTHKTSKDLPYFGSIGHMYWCFWQYLEIEYTDGTQLLKILSDQVIQRDQFSRKGTKEYPGIDTTIENDLSWLKSQFINIINAITDQGEGQGVVNSIVSNFQESFSDELIAKFAPPSPPEKPADEYQMVAAVAPQNQADPEALRKRYPNYNDQGEIKPGTSGRAQARIDNDALDHFELFVQIKNLIQNSKPGEYTTWDVWHQEAGNQWTADMLQPDPNRDSKYGLPKATDIAQALNELKHESTTYDLLSKAGVGTIKGVTTQLNNYWSNPRGQFPSPAMGGSGDRLSICWAITGKVPKLWDGVKSLSRKGKMYHACQGMILDTATAQPDHMPLVEIYHSCKGSNDCKTEGGCGFVQGVLSSGNCGSSKTFCDSTVSVPANNNCGGRGGCAVPISASQLYPEPTPNPDNPEGCKEGDIIKGTMQVFKFDADFKPSPLTTIPYEKGDAVYDKAWEAYCEVLKDKGKTPPEKPAPHKLRLAFPPST